MTPLISTRDLSYAYPDGQIALQSINLTIHRGEKVGLMGANGAGKSTLLLHLNGIFAATSGEIKVDGMSVGKKNIQKIRSFIGLVFQNPDDQLFSPTVYDDVAFGPLYAGLSKQKIEESVQFALSAVGMADYCERSPYHLSSGEKKRIAIATVLSMHPEILVLDEPSAGLDPRGRRELIEWLQAQPQTLLIASHDMDLVQQITQRTIILNHGRIVADGATQTILSDTPLLFEYGLI
ncbi:MAG: ABC transporter ATP-binding protein [Anaerolineaceae bacterium]|nr:ABC transporter ATP-binding protein [Anaerolineaceae bacterium]